MTYTKQTWVNGRAGGTPLSAARLNHIEDGVEAVATAADDLGGRVTTTSSQVTTLSGRVAALEGAPAGVTQEYVDAIGVSAPVNNTVVRRDSTGWIGVSGIYGLTDPQQSGDAATKGYVDGIGTTEPVPDTVVRRDASAWTQIAGIYGMAELPPDYAGRTTAAPIGYVIDNIATRMASGVAGLPAGTTLTVTKSGSTWPARPTSRADIVVAWKGADPSPAIVSSGTGGMLDNVDYRLVTP